MLLHQDRDSHASPPLEEGGEEGRAGGAALSSSLLAGAVSRGDQPVYQSCRAHGQAELNQAFPLA